jgi:hypothetical protein
MLTAWLDVIQNWNWEAKLCRVFANMCKEVAVSYFHYMLFCWRDLGKPRSVFPIVVHEEPSEYKAAVKRGTVKFGLAHYHVD